MYNRSVVCVLIMEYFPNSSQDISTAISECSSLRLADLYDFDFSESDEEPIQAPSYSSLSSADEEIPECEDDQDVIECEDQQQAMHNNLS